MAHGHLLLCQAMKIAAEILLMYTISFVFCYPISLLVPFQIEGWCRFTLIRDVIYKVYANCTKPYLPPLQQCEKYLTKRIQAKGSAGFPGPRLQQLDSFTSRK